MWVVSQRSPQGAAACSSHVAARAPTTGTGGTVPFYGDAPGRHPHAAAAPPALCELRRDRGQRRGAPRPSRQLDGPCRPAHPWGTILGAGGEFAPPDDTGEAGGLDPARLTLTVGFGPGLFDGRFGLAGKRPPELADLPRFEKDQLDPARSGGDICVQACADDPQVAFHAIRNLTRDARAAPPRCGGCRRASSRRTAGGAGTPRNLMGFKDGTANLDPADADADGPNVWAAAGAGFGWMAGGSYLVARKIRIRIEQWDRTALGEQEKFVGRVKDSRRAARGHARSTRRSTPSKLDVASHIRLANPRTGDDSERERILRRGYNFDEGIDGIGQIAPASSSSATSRTRAASSSRSRRGSPPTTCSTSTSSTPAARSSRSRRASSRAATSARPCWPDAAGRAYDAPKRTGRHVIVADYTIKALADVTDFLGDYPGEMRLATYEIGAEQAALTWRRMPAQTGGKGSYGHRHKTQEEIYLVVSGTLQFKLDDDVVDVPAGTVVRVAPEVVRSVWNDGPDDAELVIAARKIDDPSGDAELVPDFWPAS